MNPYTALGRILVVAVAAVASLPSAAAVIALGGAYEVSYDINMNPGTVSRSDVNNVFIFESNGSTLNVDYGFSIPGTGVSRLTHVSPFAPTSTLVAGVIRGVPGVGDGAEHVYLLVNNGFAESAVGYKWSEVFPGSGGVRMRHDVFIDLVEDAAAGDATALASITQFAVTDAASAWFGTTGAFSVSEFSLSPPPVGRSVPEPTTLALLTLALGVIPLVIRRRGRRASY